MDKSIKTLEDISKQCIAESSSYQFSKTMTLSDKYRKGRDDALNWIGLMMVIGCKSTTGLNRT